MRRLNAGLLALLLLFAATACGGDDDTSSTKDTTGSSSDEGDDAASADLPTEDELEAQLLTLDDLPEGWTVDTSADDEDDGDEDESDDSEPECLKEAEEDLSQESVGVDFVQGEDFPAINEELETYDEDVIADELHTAIEKIDGCGEFDMESDDITLHGTITRIADFAQVGDESATWSMELGAEGLTIEFLITYFRAGPIGASISYAEPGKADRQLYRQLVDTAARKLAA
jgi:hypothetical protein